MALGRRRKSARDHLACVTVSLECLSLFQVSQILESGRKIDEETQKQNKTGGRLELAPVFHVFLLIFPSYD